MKKSNSNRSVALVLTIALMLTTVFAVPLAASAATPDRYLPFGIHVVI